MISVIVCAKNESKFIGECVLSILSQSFKDFEFIIVDDNSDDSTGKIIRSIPDTRLRYILNGKNEGIARSRNIGVNMAKGEYIFFTDADCHVSKEWLASGFKVLSSVPEVVGVEGMTCYADKSPTFSHKIVQNTDGGRYITANIAYRKSVFQRLGGFDERLGNHIEDNEFAKRAKLIGPIVWCPEMVVVHQAKIWNFSMIMERANREKSMIYIYKKHGFPDKKWRRRIILPRHLLYLIFPPSLMLNLFCSKFRRWEDFRMLLYIYIQSMYVRLVIWKSAIKERILVI